MDGVSQTPVQVCRLEYCLAPMLIWTIVLKARVDVVEQNYPNRPLAPSCLTVIQLNGPQSSTEPEL